MRLLPVLALPLVLAATSCGRNPASRTEASVTAQDVFARFDRFVHAPLSEQARLADELQRLGSAAVPYLETKLRATANLDERAAALIILQRLNERRRPQEFTEGQIRQYLAWLADQDVVVRTYAMESLIQAGNRFRPQIEQYAAHAGDAVWGKLAIVLRETR